MFRHNSFGIVHTQLILNRLLNFAMACFRKFDQLTHMTGNRLDEILQNPIGFCRICPAEQNKHEELEGIIVIKHLIHLISLVCVCRC